jgi:hypothetical protein
MRSEANLLLHGLLLLLSLLAVALIVQIIVIIGRNLFPSLRENVVN